MLLNEFEQKIKEKLEDLGVLEEYPYIENGVLGKAETFEDVMFKAVFSYKSFEIIEKTSRCYSVKEQRVIQEIIRYQKEMGAYYAPFLNNKQVKANRTHEEVKNILNKANKKNRGIYFVTGLGGYTSTTLYENPILVPGLGHGKSVGCGQKKKFRLYGKLLKILPATLKLYDGYSLECCYPIRIRDQPLFCESIYEVYGLALRHKEDLFLEKERTFYSSQEKKIVKLLKEVQ